jgi:hypothetical protein
MLVRDSEGRLVIISRKDCKNERSYNDKIFNIRLNYLKKFKNVCHISPENIPKELKSQTFLKDSSDD